MSLNKVMLIGHVGKDPEIRYMEGGICTATFNLATNTPGYTLPNGTTVPERTEWHRILLWRHLAEITEKYVRKGDKIYIEGELRYRSYNDVKGRTQQVTEVWAKNLELLGNRPAAEQQPSSPSPTSPIKKEELPF